MNRRTAPGFHLPKRMQFRPGYVYLFRDREDGAHKIGRSEFPWHRRDSSYRRCDIVHTILTNDSHYLERAVQIRFQVRWLSGEWFDLTDDDMAAVQSVSTVMYHGLPACPVSRDVETGRTLPILGRTDWRAARHVGGPNPEWDRWWQQTTIIKPARHN